MREVGWIYTDLSDSDLTAVYFEDVRLDHLTVNYRTRLDTDIPMQRGDRRIPVEQIPDILRSFRRAFVEAEIWNEADRFLRAERTTRRRELAWPAIQLSSPRTIGPWLGDGIADWTTGYGTQLGRVALAATAAILAFTLLYSVAGVPGDINGGGGGVLKALYFSITTFATLGLGDVAYSDAHPILRIATGLEVICGAVAIALVVTVLSRKWFR